MERRKSKNDWVGYKIIYSRNSSTRNDVEVIVDEKMKKRMIEKIRKIDRVIMVKEVIEDKVLNIVSAYNLQVKYE